MSIVLKEIWKKPRPFLNVFLQLGFYTALVKTKIGIITRKAFYELWKSASVAKVCVLSEHLPVLMNIKACALVSAVMQHRMMKDAQRAMAPWMGGQPLYGQMSNGSQMNPLLYTGTHTQHTPHALRN